MTIKDWESWYAHRVKLLLKLQRLSVVSDGSVSEAIVNTYVAFVAGLQNLRSAHRAPTMSACISTRDDVSKRTT